VCPTCLCHAGDDALARAMRAGDADAPDPPALRPCAGALRRALRRRAGPGTGGHRQEVFARAYLALRAEATRRRDRPSERVGSARRSPAACACTALSPPAPAARVSSSCSAASSRTCRPRPRTRRPGRRRGRASPPRRPARGRGRARRRRGHPRAVDADDDGGEGAHRRVPVDACTRGRARRGRPRWSATILPGGDQAGVSPISDRIPESPATRAPRYRGAAPVSRTARMDGRSVRGRTGRTRAPRSRRPP
jgi:hypothetical protein